MKTKKIIVEIICFALLMNWFYEGIYKIAYFQQFGVYIGNAPLLESFGGFNKYAIPFGEVVLAVMLIIQKYRRVALYCTIGLSIAFILWIMSVYLFTHRLFWPYHALWEKPTWMSRMLVSLGMCWGAFTVILLYRDTAGKKNNFSKSLRNIPANAS
jgi:hypothetical protein